MQLLFAAEIFPKSLNTNYTSNKIVSYELCNKFGTKTRLKPLYEQLQVLNINEIYKLEVAKFMAKVNLNKLPLFCGNQLTIFRTLSSIHTYLTRSAFSKSFYVQITSLVKTNQSFKISCVKIWTSVPRHIRDKVLTSSDKTSSEILKLLKSHTCWQVKPLFTSRGGVEDTRLEAKAKDTKKIRGQGQGQPFRGQTLSRPRTGMLEAKDRNARGQGQGPRTQAQVVYKKKKVSTKIF